MKPCPRCHAVLANDLEACSHCGAHQGQLSSPEPALPAHDRRRPGLHEKLGMEPIVLVHWIGALGVSGFVYYNWGPQAALITLCVLIALPRVLLELS